jgi:hypothetical protein
MHHSPVLANEQVELQSWYYIDWDAEKLFHLEILEYFETWKCFKLSSISSALSAICIANN